MACLSSEEGTGPSDLCGAGGLVFSRGRYTRVHDSHSFLAMIASRFRCRWWQVPEQKRRFENHLPDGWRLRTITVQQFSQRLVIRKL